MNYERNRVYFFPIEKIVPIRKKIGPNQIYLVIIGIFLLWSGTGGVAKVDAFLKSNNVDMVSDTTATANKVNEFTDSALTKEQMYSIVGDIVSLWGGIRGGPPIGVIFGFLVMGIGIAWIAFVIVFNVIDARKADTFNANRTIVTDSEIDNICKNNINGNFKSMALKKLGLEETQVQEIAPIQFEGYYFGDLKSSEWVLRVGDDERRRTSHYEATIFFFSVDQVYCYQHRFSLLEKDVRQDITEEYFYRDIVSASTRSNTIKYKKEKNPVVVNVEEFTLSTTGGVAINASILDSESAERSVQNIRTLLRSKKQSA